MMKEVSKIPTLSEGDRRLTKLSASVFNQFPRSRADVSLACAVHYLWEWKDTRCLWLCRGEINFD
jgi:hypothetical protein